MDDDDDSDDDEAPPPSPSAVCRMPDREKHPLRKAEDFMMGAAPPSTIVPKVRCCPPCSSCWAQADLPTVPVLWQIDAAAPPVLFPSPPKKLLKAVGDAIRDWNMIEDVSRQATTVQLEVQVGDVG